MSRIIAVIGTAGRDKHIPMTLDHWNHMCEVVWHECSPDTTLVSGGAAWADHVAVWAYLNDHCDDLILHLPAPFMVMLNSGRFSGDYGTSGGTANYYHKKFSSVLGCDTLSHIRLAIEKGAFVTDQPVANGYAAMAVRNRLVADACTHMIAFTFGEGDVPADGGTKITWDMAADKERVHVPLRK